MKTTAQISTLLKWCREKEIEIDPRLEVVATTVTAIGVRAKRDCFAFPATPTPHQIPLTVVKIPKAVVLSVRTCSLSRHINPIPYGHGAHLCLALALHGELILGGSSNWHGYLQSLPIDTVNLALFWGTDQGSSLFGPHVISDGIEARAWLKGTEIEKELRNHESGEDLLSEVDDYYETAVQPLMHELGLTSSIAGYYRAYALVSSRAFLVDAYHGLSMVPIADAFDHAIENHVHLESDFDVCVFCGALDECPHDRHEGEGHDPSSDGAPSLPMRAGTVSFPEDAPCQELPSSNLIHAAETDNTCDMVSNLPITAGSEVFNTYGEHLRNVTLLVRYGFMIDGNEWDSVNWTVLDLLSSLSTLPSGTQDKVETRDLVALWTTPSFHRPRNIWAESTLVYYFELDEDQYRETQRSTTAQLANDLGPHIPDLEMTLCLNGDGKISDRLWACCALFVIHQPQWSRRLQGVDRDEVLTRLAYKQMEAEAKIFDGDEVMPDDDPDTETEVRTQTVDRDPSDTARTQLWQNSSGEFLSDLAQVVDRVCKWRLSRMVRSKDMTCSEVAEALDDAPGSKHRTRMAMTEVINEKSLLETCISLWKQLIL